MVTRTTTFAFDGIEARPVDVQVQTMSGQCVFTIVGLPDKAVGESRERVRAAFASIGLGLPPERIIVNLAPADLPKEGSHYDLAIALALMAAIGAIPRDMIEDAAAFGELSLDGRLASAPGALPAAIAAHAQGLRFICPKACGAEAAWSGADVLAAPDLLSIVNHVRGNRPLEKVAPGELLAARDGLDMRDVKGQDRGKRAFEIAAAGGHNLLISGPPGCGKSMLAHRLPGLLPPLNAEELLESSMIHSVAGLIERGSLRRDRPFRAPHHSASMAAMVGGGIRAKPGEVSLAHHGVLFLDELPEFSPTTLDALRQPLENGDVVIARANRHVRYPARFQLIGAMNPCRCGAATPAECRRGPKCGEDYRNRLSAPFLDRMDLSLDLPAVSAVDLTQSAVGETSEQIRDRILIARDAQAQRQQNGLNAALSAAQLEPHAFDCDPAAIASLQRAAQQFNLTARSYHKALRVARTIADLAECTTIRRDHVMEALSFRRVEAQDHASANLRKGVNSQAIAHIRSV